MALLLIRPQVSGLDFGPRYSLRIRVSGLNIGYGLRASIQDTGYEA